MGNGFQNVTPLSMRECVGLGALGGLVVGVATYPAIENGYVDLFLQPDVAEWIGFAIRILVVSALGGLWGYLHRPEYNRLRAFQLGLVAPAAIAGLLYANDGGPETVTEKNADQAMLSGAIEEPSYGFTIIGRARAGGLFDRIVIAPTAPSKPIILRIVKGIFGR